jgi:hypothetical protein
VIETITRAVSSPEADTGSLLGMGLCPVLPFVGWLTLWERLAAAAAAMTAARQSQDMARVPAA